MQLQQSAKTWNLGDTSFRRKNVMEDYHELLVVLREFRKVNTMWDNTAQASFFMMIKEHTELVSTNENNQANMARRARTMTNGLEKLGLCDKSRGITQVGKAYLNLDKNLLNMDTLEEKLLLKPQNIIFLRQLLKLEVFSPDGEKSFKPFEFCLRLLSRYDSMPQEHFKLIVQSIKPADNLKNIINEYSKVVSGELSFNSFCIQYLYSTEYDSAAEYFIQTGHGFEEVFKNRKTQGSVDKYEIFYQKLLQYKSTAITHVFEELIDIIKDSVVKKAFSTTKYFDIPKGKLSQQEFIKQNSDNRLLNSQGEQFRKEFVRLFDVSKTIDLINEYYDMTVRVFNLSGVIDFSHSTVHISNLYLKELFECINEIPADTQKSEGEYEEKFYASDIGSAHILNLLPGDIEKTDELIVLKYNLSKKQHINSFMANKARSGFAKFIEEKFSNSTLIEILEHICKRKDKEVARLVTDNATVPTIYEYIVGIAWHRISGGKFDLLNSLNLTLDGSSLPLSHAGGGDGDIVIKYKDHYTMLEATLMDMNNQKRGELEPVIRHSVNLAVDKKPETTLTFFIANELDNNVVNIFKACGKLRLESSKNKGNYIDGVNIFSLTTKELVGFLRHKITYEKILQTINNLHLCDENADMIVEENWRESFVSMCIE